MKESELKKLKKELMKPGWTEDLHHSLEELPKADVKYIVESMTDTEIYQKVNNRQYQEDYIEDYLNYLWDISDTAYWKHVKTTLNVKHGILWSDILSHLERMCQHIIPDDVLNAVLDFAVNCDENIKQDLEVIGCVIKAQVEKFGRLDEIKKYISLLDKDEQNPANIRINEMLTCNCNYQFY